MAQRGATTRKKKVQQPFQNIQNHKTYKREEKKKQCLMGWGRQTLEGGPGSPRKAQKDPKKGQAERTKSPLHQDEKRGCRRRKRKKKSAITQVSTKEKTVVRGREEVDHQRRAKRGQMGETAGGTEELLYVGPREEEERCNGQEFEEGDSLGKKGKRKEKGFGDRVGVKLAPEKESQTQ